VCVLSVTADRTTQKKMALRAAAAAAVEVTEAAEAAEVFGAEEAAGVAYNLAADENGNDAIRNLDAVINGIAQGGNAVDDDAVQNTMEG
jgi:hypothetical protein